MAVSKNLRTFAGDQTQQLMDNSNSKSPDVEVLTFMKGDEFATVVTDGSRHRSFEWEDSREHDSLKSAIAFLESRGYHIVPDKFPEDWR